MPASLPFIPETEQTDIRIENLSLSPGGLELFKDFSLTIPAGKVTAFLGRSGVGKSTLLRALAGLSVPEAGSIGFEDGAGLDGQVALMAQQALLMPWLNLTRNICLGATLRRQRPDLARAQAILADVQLADRADDYPDVLSGGMRQRVALARTLMEDRPVICMDEPFSAIDAVTRMELHALAIRLLAGRTVVLVTHDPLEALVRADKIVVLGKTPVDITLQLDLDNAVHGQAPRNPAGETLAPLHNLLLSNLRGPVPS